MSVRIAAVIALVAIPAHAQDPSPQPATHNITVIDARDLQAAQDAGSQPPDPPAGRDAWSLRVHTSGGFTGQGVGSVTISSNGQVECSPASCATPVSQASLRQVRMALTSILDAAWIRRSSGLCSDCVRTTVTLRRREGDAVRMFVATWEDGQSPAPEMRELRRLAFELRDARIGQR